MSNNIQRFGRVGVKVLKQGADVEVTHTELEHWKTMRHSNITMLLGWHASNDGDSDSGPSRLPFIVTEFISTTLAQCLHHDETGRYRWCGKGRSIAQVQL
jgi:hypothetical protein